MFACTIGADIERNLPVWKPQAAPARPPTPPEPPPDPQQAQGPGQRRAGTETKDEKADPLKELAREVMGAAS